MHQATAPGRVPLSASRHDPEDLIVLFDREFAASENTVLRRGGDEPLYLPASADRRRHRILFARGFYASALHEIAHWCIAGHDRRQLEDYGYWYRPDGRDAATQQCFERVERRPQALEWAFSDAAAFPFRVSLDNLSGAAADVAGFIAAVTAERQQLEREGFPPRARRFLDALRRCYGR